MSGIEQLEQDYGFNTEIALQVDPDLLDTSAGGEASPSLAYWTMLYNGIASSPRYAVFARSRISSWQGEGWENHRLLWGRVCVYEGMQPSDIEFVEAGDDERARVIIDRPHQRFEYNGELTVDLACGKPLILAIAAQQLSELKKLPERRRICSRSLLRSLALCLTMLPQPLCGESTRFHDLPRAVAT